MVIQTWATKEHYVSFRQAATCDLFQKSCQRTLWYSLAGFSVIPVSKLRIKATQVLFRNEIAMKNDIVVC